MKSRLPCRAPCGSRSAGTPASALLALLGALAICSPAAHAVAPPRLTRLADLPLHEVPAAPVSGAMIPDSFAVLLTGDGGWATLAREVSGELSRRRPRGGAEFAEILLEGTRSRCRRSRSCADYHCLRHPLEAPARPADRLLLRGRCPALPVSTPAGCDARCRDVRDPVGAGTHDRSTYFAVAASSGKGRTRCTPRSRRWVQRGYCACTAMAMAIHPATKPDSVA